MIIKIGPVLAYEPLNRSIMNIIKDKIDFGVIHTYAKPYGGFKILREKDSVRMSAKEIYEESLSFPQLRVDWRLQKALNTMEVEHTNMYLLQ